MYFKTILYNMQNRLLGIGLTQEDRIRPDPDPQHWLKLSGKFSASCSLNFKDKRGLGPGLGTEKVDLSS